MTAKPTTSFDRKKYARLVSHAMPVLVETEEENERLLAEVSRLMDKKTLSPEETRVLDLLVKLIEDFEDKHYQLNAATPLSVLKHLMESRQVKAKDLWPVFGSRGITSEVLSGKRGISVARAKKLAGFFNVSVELFI